ncbi:MAG: trypsin-like peptidase domain-containing protein [Planctomycetes bacterium]|nr:trypsin-like peptidase domain-containing protein [Planctomycetota bacterium]
MRTLRDTLSLLGVGLLFFAPVGRCDAANATLSRTELSRVWNEQFSPPENSQSNSAAKLPASNLSPGAQLRSDRPHPAVARIIVPEGNATSYGSGTLVDARDQFGLVITNWHVVRDAQGAIEVVFPGGFKSKARALKVDADWDLAALVIWRPQIEPVTIAQTAPQPGDQLTICGYGQGMYRAATGRCTQYYAPRLDFPRHMVELDVEARQGDSGGPIFNRDGELAGVLFGAGQGTTLGSFGGRVESFLATLAPDIGQTVDVSLVRDEVPPPVSLPEKDLQAEAKPAKPQPPVEPPPADLARQSDDDNSSWQSSHGQVAAMWPKDESAEPAPQVTRQQVQQLTATEAASWESVPSNNRFEQIKTGLAVIGVMALAVLALRVAR